MQGPWNRRSIRIGLFFLFSTAFSACTGPAPQPSQAQAGGATAPVPQSESGQAPGIPSASPTPANSIPSVAVPRSDTGIIANPIVPPTRESVSNERQSAPPAVSPETRSTATLSIQVRGKARFGALYFQDQPAHRDRVLQYFQDKGAEVLFHSEALGYVDAELEWSRLPAFLKDLRSLGIEESMLKLELDGMGTGGGSSANPMPEVTSLPGSPSEPPVAAGSGAEPGNSSMLGSAHSAGYGARISEFRAAVARDLGGTPQDYEGHGTLVAVYDQGLDVSRTDIFGDRLNDFFVGDEANWLDAKLTLSEWKASHHLENTPVGLGDWENDPGLRFVDLSETDFADDLNGNGTKTDSLTFAIIEREGRVRARLLPSLGFRAGFGVEFEDYRVAKTSGKNGVINLWNGQPYLRPSLDSTLGVTLYNPGSSAGVLKFRKKKGVQQVAVLGLRTGAEHGIANLHMVGGDFEVPAPASTPGAQNSAYRYQGVAPKTGFLGMQSWKTNGKNYGDGWIPLARSMIQAVEAGADVLDLDIFTPGSRQGADLLSRLACRIVRQSNAVPVVAVHNYGPLPNSIQSLAQSPCVLGIGASHSRAALRFGRNQGSVDPRLATDGQPADDLVQTANYSGRGMGMNGMLKPDLLAPAYGYTAYGSRFTRFAGTSGATPTTSGAVALLKQAARLKGVELGFYAVKHLLQSSSAAVYDPASGSFPSSVDPGGSAEPRGRERGHLGSTMRDGYGNLDLLKAWQLFLKELVGQRRMLPPLALSGWKVIQVDSSTSVSLVSLEWVREAVSGSGTAPEPMKFWFEGDPELLQRVRFFDVTTGVLSPDLVKDLPMLGETQSTRLAIDLGTLSWERLSAGDHVATLKGLRLSVWERLSESERRRAVDYLQPIVVTKGLPVGERELLGSRPLYADQVQNFELAGQPGDIYWIRGESVCLSNSGNGAVSTPAAGALALYADGEAEIGSAYQIPNGYSPGVLSAQPLQVRTTRGLMRIAVARRSQNTCDGAVQARIRVDHTSLAVDSQISAIRVRDSKIEVDAWVDLTPRGAGWNVEDGLALARTLKVRTETGHLRFSRSYTEPVELVVPRGTLRVRVVPANAGQFQGGIAALKEDKWEWVAQTDSQSVLGLGSEFGRKAGQWVGLETTDFEVGKRIRVEGTSEYRVEFWVDLAEGDTINLQSGSAFPAAGLSRWEPGQRKRLNFRGTFPQARAQEFSFFTTPEWQAVAVARYLLSETPSGGESDGDYRYLGQEYYRGEVQWPLPPFRSP